MKHRAVILGGGFAGLWSARALAADAAAGRIDVTLVSSRPTSDFNPLLPDVIGGRIRRRSAAWDLRHAEQRWSLTFRQADALHLDADRRIVETSAGELPFDVAIVATGATTNFRGRDDIQADALKLDSAADADVIRNAARKDDLTDETLLIAGGGPTGVEVATNLRLRCLPRRPRIILAEYLPRLCSLLPGSHGRYILRNLRRMGIDVRLETTVDSLDGRAVQLSDGDRIGNATLIWAAGVTPGEVARNLPGGSTAGRATTDEYLRVGEGIFAAGDAAGFVLPGEDRPIRMSVQHAIGGGLGAAHNALRDIAGRPLKPFRPRDLGYIVPMANGRSCGVVLGAPVFGAAATMLHYMMSGFRSASSSNAVGVLRDALAAYLDARRFD